MWAILLCLLAPAAVAAGPSPSGWEFAGQAGYGRLSLTSDQEGRHTLGTFALSGRAGYAVLPQAVLGLELGGWLAQTYPMKGKPLFIRAGGGAAWYTNHRPEGHGGSGRGAWLAGVGCELPVSISVSVVSIGWLWRKP